MQKQLIARLVLVSYSCQGIASLIYQVSWEQAMEKIVGLAVPTMAMIVSIFLLGMGLGAYLFSKIQIDCRSAIKFYSLGQFLLFAVGFIFAASHGLNFLTDLSTQNIEWLSLVYLVRLSAVGLYLLITAVLIGAGFPILLSLCSACQLNISARKIYLFNVLGSMIGAILTGFVLLPHLGIAKTTVLAALLHLFAGLAIIAFTPAFKLQANGELPIEENNVLPTQNSLPENNPPLFAIVVISGFFNMFLELIFIRYYSLIIGSSTSAYPLVLLIVLLALCGGIYLAKTLFQTRLNLSVLFLIAGGSLLLNSVFLSQLPFIFVGLKSLVGFFCSCIIIMLGTIFPSCLCLGAVLPYCFNFAGKNAVPRQITPGQMYAVNLFAAVAGCMAGGTIAIPFLNLFSTHAICLAFLLSAAILLWTGIYIYGHSFTNKNILLPTTIILGLLLCVTFSLSWNEAALTAGLSYLSPEDLKAIKHLTKAVDLPIVFYQEGLSSTVTVTANPKLNIISLKTDGQTEAALPQNANLPAPSSDEKTQKMLGFLPFLFCHLQPKNVFLLGYGTGITASSILLNPHVSKLTIAELEPAVINASHCFVQSAAANPRTNLEIIDGRCLLSLLNKRYQIIISQPGEPSRSGSAYLYTLEFWQLAKKRLQSGGVFCQWLPLYAIDRNNLISLCRTFTCVFPNAYIAKPDRSAEFILLGLNSNEMPSTLSSTFISTAAWLAKYDQNEVTKTLNKDDFPFVQYRLQSLLMARGNSINSDIEPIVSDPFSPTQESTLLK